METRRAFSSGEKAYGGYSTHSLPTRNAEKADKKDVPKYVSDKAEEIKANQKEEDIGKAYAVAWSIYCKYKEPGSPHCTKKPDEYFPSRNKKKGSVSSELREKRLTLKIASTLDIMVSAGLTECLKMIKREVGFHNKRMINIIMYKWTTGKYPMFLLKYGQEAQILGKISNDIYQEKKPQKISYLEERKANEVLLKVFKYVYQIWGARLWSKIWLMSEDMSWGAIRLELLNLGNKVEHGYHYSRLLRVLFPE
jgi:hypothetical protein